MKAADILAKSREELKTLLLDLAREQMNLRFQNAAGQLENKARIRTVRRDIARIKTIMTQKALKKASEQ